MDDSLDVFAAHGTGGIVGALLTGVFAEEAWGGTNGLLFGNPGLMWAQAVAVFVPLRRTAKDEVIGLDITQHGEEGYARGERAVLVLSDITIPRKTRLRGSATAPLAPAGEGV